MVKKSILSSLLIVLTFFVMVGCSGNNKEQEDKKVVEDFLREYYSQLVFTPDEWVKVKTSVEQMTSDSDFKNIEFVSEFDDLLTETCLVRMGKNRLIPNFAMENPEIKMAEIDDIEYLILEEGKYKISYTLKLEEKNEEKKIANNIEVSVISINEKRLIDTIFGDFLWE